MVEFSPTAYSASSASSDFPLKATPSSLALAPHAPITSPSLAISARPLDRSPLNLPHADKARNVDAIDTPTYPAREHPVLGVTELLEQIFWNLGYKDLLLRAQLTSKFWMECLEGSLKLKQKCFLVGDFETTNERYRVHDSPEMLCEGGSHMVIYQSSLDTLKRLVLEQDEDRAPHQLLEASFTGCRPDLDDHFTTHNICEKFDLAFEAVGYGDSAVTLIHDCWRLYLADFFDKILFTLKSLQSGTKPASWASHQITWPASTKIYITETNVLDSFMWNARGDRILQNPTGVTVQQLILAIIDIARSMLKSYLRKESVRGSAQCQRGLKKALFKSKQVDELVDAMF
ncbi:hypothetical protein N0V90_001005 [Kalmusia sp. IMI 367209]|nr:hypothetical protein N0V90_001005 [Kalmusia sp. IMI 367209]